MQGPFPPPLPLLVLAAWAAVFSFLAVALRLMGTGAVCL